MGSEKGDHPTCCQRHYIHMYVYVMSLVTTLFLSYSYQAIKDLRSLIGDHDLDHFFRDRELIAITSENDRYLLNFLASRSRSYVRVVNMGFSFWSWTSSSIELSQYLDGWPGRKNDMPSVPGGVSPFFFSFYTTFFLSFFLFLSHFFLSFFLIFFWQNEPRTIA